jgi:hypothetical protein
MRTMNKTLVYTFYYMKYCSAFYIYKTMACLQEVRKTIVLSLPPSNVTAQVIVDCTVDVSESVRKTAYCILANKFPLQSLR